MSALLYLYLFHGTWAQSSSITRSEQVIGRLYTEAILGNRVFDGALAHADSMLALCNGDVDAALIRMARYDVSASFARGALAGVGGFATLLVTVPTAAPASICPRDCPPHLGSGIN